MRASASVSQSAPRRRLRPPTRGRALALLFLAVVLTILALGYAVFEYERQRLHRAANNYLSGLMTAKLRQIEAWRRDRISELSVLARNPAVNDSLHKVLAGNTAAGQHLRESFMPLVAIDRYDSLYVVDPAADVRFHVGMDPRLPDDFRLLVRAALVTGAPQLVHVLTADNQVRLHLLSVIAGPRADAPSGVIGVQLDPAYFAEPVLFSWPVPESSGEVLLVQTAPGGVHFLTAGRDIRAGTLMPRDRAQVAAAALDTQGPLAGTDYRGRPVLAMASAIENTPWRLLIKIDQREVFAPIRELALWIVAVTVLVIAAAAWLIYMWWRSERARFRLEAARDRAALARHFDYLAKYANDIILLADERGRILEVNDRAVELYGYSRDALLGMTIKQLRAPTEQSSFDYEWALLRAEKAHIYEVMHQSSDGRIIPIESSSRVIDIDGTPFYQVVARDISERKRAQRALQRLNHLYATLAQTNEAIVRVRDRQTLFQEICRIAVEHGKFVDAWIALHDEHTGELLTTAHAGEHPELFAALRLPVESEQAAQLGVSTCAFASGDVCVSNDFAADPRTRNWRELARRGVRAAASLPISENTRLTGVLSVYAKERDYFDEQTMALLRQMARDISFALDNFQREALRARAETQTRASEYRYRQLIEHMSSGMVVYEPIENGTDFIVRDVNLAFTRIERIPREVAVGRRLSSAEPEFHGPGVSEALQRVWLTGKPESLEINFKRNGQSEWRNLYVYALPGQFVVIVYDDISQRKAAELQLRASEERLALVLQGVNDGYWDIDYETNDYYFSRRFAEMFGYDTQDLAHLSEAWIALVHPDDMDEVEQALKAHLAGKSPQYASEHRMLHRDGSVIWVQARGTVVRRGKDGTALRMTGTHRDITERKREENQLRLWATVFEGTQEGIFITDDEARIVSANAAFSAITGYTLEEMRGRNPRMFSSGEQSRAFYQNMWASINETGSWQGEIRDRRKNGEVFPMYTSITVTRDARGALQNYIAICVDISERKATEARIRFLAHHDVLTGLPNRELLEDRIGQALAHARRTETRIGVLFVDIDRFKNVNDSLGHHMGDELLKIAAQRLRACVRVDDSVSRQGGDEFILLVTELEDASDAGQVAQKVLEVISQPFTLDSSEVHVTASVGIAVYPEDGTDSETLIRNADAAMYFAKERGRNNFQFFVRELNLRALRRISVESALKSAIDHGDFVLYYQPQVDIWKNDLVGIEALLRWKWGERLVRPGEFIPVAEESGLILPIGDWVLAQACRQQRQWLREGLPPVNMAVNISAAQFHRKELLREVERIVTGNCASPNLLEMELTESLIMEDAEASMRILQALKDMGITLAIDDFGTGYSSLSYLRRFRIDRLKVDQSFVRDMVKDPIDRAITEAIISLGKSLGLRTIAEGVENQGEIDLLRESQCDELQGYYFAPPLAPDEFMRWWRRRVDAVERTPND
ncbi:MAG: PAS domain S-box protein [Gammaproteobacteria bacterium]|nr:PAS domain S-box protein [Gammaproteobacteria bacterium]